MRAVAAAGWANASPPAPTARKARVTTTATDNALMPSLDDLIRPCQQRGRDRQTQRLGGLEVDDQLKSARALDWQISRARASQNSVDVLGSLPEQIRLDGTVTDQPACAGVSGEDARRREFMALSNFGDSAQLRKE